VKYAFIQTQKKYYTITRLCDVLEVSTSGYYDWVDRPMSQRDVDNQRLTLKLHCFHQQSKQIYGSPNLHKDLLDDGEKVGIKRVERLMKKAGIQSKISKKFVVAKNSKHSHQVAENLLERNFRTGEKNVVWVTDTTFIHTREGWLYLATVMDLYSRKIIGWSMSERNNRTLVCDALLMALWRRKHPKKVIVHSDQGSTYASNDYQALLKKRKLICSMSRRGNCWDNAVAESFYGSLKNEWVNWEDYKTRDQARKSIFNYIEMFYNRKRRHSYLGYISPEEFELMNVS
jgi:transposase InsO family protein